MALEVVILAAGQGTRMKSNLPKVLHRLGGVSLLQQQLKTVRKLNPERIHVVIGHGADQIKQALTEEDVNWVLQEKQLGTGHALQQALPGCQPVNSLLVLVGDTPLIGKETLETLTGLNAHLGVLTVVLDNPFGYGRIVRTEDNRISAIIEEKDASAEQKAIREINTGIMVAQVADFAAWLEKLNNDNAQGEYLLTDIVTLANAENKTVIASITPDEGEVMGINDMQQLAQAERELQKRTAEELMRKGVQLLDPARFDVRGELETGKGVVIDVNCIFEGKVVLEDGVKIGSNCFIRDCIIRRGSIVKPNSVLEESEVGVECQVGPFARLRPGTRLAEAVSIGNFVEVKKSVIGKGTKASHLSYLGDATIGEQVNIGAGTITCNYDGVNKHETHLGDNVFVGSNSALVAPIEISDNVYIAAGSTITKPVKAGSLSIARGRQRDIENWQSRKDNSSKKD